MIIACGAQGLDFIERSVPPDHYTVTDLFLVSVPEESAFSSWIRCQDLVDIQEVKFV